MENSKGVAVVLMSEESEQLGGQLVLEEGHGPWHSGAATEGGSGRSRKVWVAVAV